MSCLHQDYPELVQALVQAEKNFGHKCPSLWRTVRLNAIRHRAVCPFHNDENPSFSVRPAKPGFAVKFKCWSCDAWGDEWDILKLFHPSENYSQRVERMSKLRKAYALLGETNQYRGPGSTKSTKPRRTICTRCSETLDDCDIKQLILEQQFSDEAIAASQELLEYLESEIELDEVHDEHSLSLTVIQKALEICYQANLHPLVFASRCGVVKWVSDREAQHMAVCDDEYCESICCRRAGGWTEEKIQEDIDLTLSERFSS